MKIAIIILFILVTLLIFYCISLAIYYYDVKTTHEDIMIMFSKEIDKLREEVKLERRVK